MGLVRVTPRDTAPTNLSITTPQGSPQAYSCAVGSSILVDSSHVPALQAAGWVRVEALDDPGTGGGGGGISQATLDAALATKADLASGRVPASQASLPVVQSIGDASATVDAATTIVLLTAQMTAQRTVTLPDAATYSARRLLIVDIVGQTTPANVVLAGASGQTINGQPTYTFGTGAFSDELVATPSGWRFDVPGVKRGGTGATDAVGARANLGAAGYANGGLLDPQGNALTAASAFSVLLSDESFDPVPRQFASATNVSAGLNDFFFLCFTAPQDMVVTGITMATQATAASGVTFARMALYQEVRRTGQGQTAGRRMLPLARTDNDTTLFTAINSAYTRPFSATGGWPTAVRLVAGRRYAVGYRLVAAVAPAMASFPLMRTQIQALEPIPGGRSSGVTITDLPGFIAATGIAASSSGHAIYFNLTTDPNSTLARPKDVVLLGDSYFDSFASWFAYGNTQQGSPVQAVFDAGIGGQRLDEMLARVTADVVARKPPLVVLTGGINDVNQGRTSAAMIADRDAIIAAVRGVGAKIVVCSAPPMTPFSAGQQAILQAYNTSTIALHNPAGGVYVSDSGRAMTTGDGITADAAKYQDTAHPNETGALAMATVFGPVLAAAAASIT